MNMTRKANVGLPHGLLLLICAIQLLFSLTEAKVKRWNEDVNPYVISRSDHPAKEERQPRTNLWFRDGNQFRSVYDYDHYGLHNSREEHVPSSDRKPASKPSISNVQMDAGSREEDNQWTPRRSSLFWAPQGHPEKSRDSRWDYFHELGQLDSPRSLHLTVRSEPPQPMNYIPENTYPQRMVWNEQGQFWGYAAQNPQLVNDRAYSPNQYMIPYDSDRAQIDTDTCIPPFCIPIDCGGPEADETDCRKNRITVSCSGPDCDPRCQNSIRCVQNDFSCDPGFYGPQCRVLNASRCWLDYSLQCAFGCTSPNDTKAPLHCVCNPWTTDPAHNQTCAPIELDVFQCPHGCNARGRCDTQTRKCQCYPGYTGPACDKELIVCPQGLTGPGCKQDIDECLSGESGCEQGCLNEFGSFRCTCHEGYELDPQDSKRCVWVGETCQRRCVPGQGDCDTEKNCVCRPGFEGQWCEHDVDECSRGMHQCEQICVNTPGSYECRCHQGYVVNTQNPHWCTPVGCEPQCVPNQGTCGPDHRCQCQPGFTGQDCGKDLDECAQGMHRCEQQCVNTHGSHYCTCHSGYKPNPNDPDRCVPDVCDSACSESQGYCDGRTCQNGGVCRSTGDSGTRCECASGFEGPLCERDIDECAHNPCSQLCYNQPGSYVCACYPNYRLESDNRTCSKVPDNPCNGGCLNGGICVPGNRCECPRGFEGERCERTRNPCDYTRECEHLCIPEQDGTFRCECRPGYQLGADGRSCLPNLDCPHGCENGGQCFRGRCLCRSGFQGVRCELDQDECKLPAAAHGCIFQCVNTHGSYECICPEGYRRLNDKRTCVRAPAMPSCDPPCQNGAVCRDNGRCECLRGYEGPDCSQDIDECASLSPCDPEFGQCRNTPGSFECTCKPGYRLMVDGRHCIAERRAQHAPHLVFRGRGQKGIVVAKQTTGRPYDPMGQREPRLVTNMRRTDAIVSRRLRRKSVALKTGLVSMYHPYATLRNQWSASAKKGDLGRIRKPSNSFNVYRTLR